jgi:hypothetical protein
MQCGGTLPDLHRTGKDSAAKFKTFVFNIRYSIALAIQKPNPDPPEPEN